MNIKGEFHGISWIGFDRERAGRRRTYILKYSLGPGEWRPITAPKDVTSEAKFRAWAIQELEQILEMGDRPKVSKAAGGKTIAELFDLWLELRRNNKDVSGATFADNRSAFKSQILKVWGPLPILAVEGKRKELRAWVRDELAAKLSPSRCRNVVSSFSIFVSDAMMEGWAPGLRLNPLESKEVRSVLPAMPKKREVVTLPEEAGQALLNCEQVELRRLVRYTLALCTGAGDGELAGCRVSDVLTLDGSYPRLQIVQALKLKPKPEADGTRRGSAIGPPKNDYRVRAIPLNDCARAALRLWLSEGWEMWVGRPPGPKDPLLPSSTGGFSRPDYASMLREDLELAGQPTTHSNGKRFDFRALRRTFSTLLSRAKVHREQREQLMGQSSNSVNTDHYTAEVPDELFDAVRRLSFRWTRGSVMPAPTAGTGDGAEGATESKSLVADPQFADSESPEPACTGEKLSLIPHVGEDAEPSNAFLNRWSQIRFLPGAPTLSSVVGEQPGNSGDSPCADPDDLGAPSDHDPLYAPRLALLAEAATRLRLTARVA